MSDTPILPPFGDRDKGGGGHISEDWREGEILNFPGSLNLTLLYRDSKEIPQLGDPKSKLSKDNFRVEFPPPLAFGTF